LDPQAQSGERTERKARFDNYKNSLLLNLCSRLESSFETADFDPLPVPKAGLGEKSSNHPRKRREWRSRDGLFTFGWQI